MTKVELTPTALLALAGVVVLGVVAWKLAGKAGELADGAIETAKDAAQAVNPLNNENVFATTVNDVGAVVTGNPKGSWSLGSWIYDVTHPGEDPTRTGGATGSW